MEHLHERVLYTFYGDRIHNFDRIVRMSNVMLPRVREAVNKFFVKEGYLEEIIVKGKGGNFFRLTEKGQLEVKYIHEKREAIRNRYNELIAEGMKPVEAAMIAATDAVKSDKSPV